MYVPFHTVLRHLAPDHVDNNISATLTRDLHNLGPEVGLLFVVNCCYGTLLSNQLTLVCTPCCPYYLVTANQNRGMQPLV